MRSSLHSYFDSKKCRLDCCFTSKGRVSRRREGTLLCPGELLVRQQSASAPQKILHRRIFLSLKRTYPFRSWQLSIIRFCGEGIAGEMHLDGKNIVPTWMFSFVLHLPVFLRTTTQLFQSPLFYRTWDAPRNPGNEVYSEANLSFRIILSVPLSLYCKGS